MSAHVILATQDPPLRVRGLLTGPATITGGYSRWDVVDRPRRIGVAVWRGMNPYRMRLPLLLDGWAGGRSVEPFIRNLERMARVVPSLGRPPVVHAEGPLPRGADTDWVIEEPPEWLDELVIRSDATGQRVRQAVTLSLVQFLEADVVVERSPARRVRERREGARRTERGAPARAARERRYTVRSGDTLSAIAARELGDSDRWQAIARANGVRDPRRLAVGQVLVMPS